MLKRSILSWLRVPMFAPVGVLFDGAPGAVVVDDPAAAGGAAPADGQPGTARPGAPTAGAPGAPAPGTPGAGAPGAGGSPRTYTYPEDRTNWVPPHRLRESTTARTTAEKERDRLNTELEQERRRVRALTGVEPAPDPAAQAEAEKTKTAFFALFPEFGELFTSLTKMGGVKAFMESVSNRGSDEFATTYWENHARGMWDSAAEQIAGELGSEKLTEPQFEYLVSSFKRWALDQAQADPAFRHRYEARDTTAIVSAFVKDFADNWIAPARRQAVNTVVTRRRVPAGGPTRPVIRQAPVTDHKTPEEAEDTGVAFMKERGFLQQP